MNFKALQDKINKISKEENIKEQEIMNGLIAHLETRYSKSITDEQERKIIDDLKSRILNILYLCENQKKSVNEHTDYSQVFNLDKVELKLIENAWNELEADGNVFSLKYEIGLTDQGTLIARNNKN